VTREIRIYVEGGGDGRETRARLRQGFGVFLSSLRDRARDQRVHWRIVACGSRESTFRDYKNALDSHPGAFNVLLVDAEGPVTAAGPWEHLHARDNWQKPDVEDKHCHLMVQCMEAWLIADREAVSQYYGQGFRENALPSNRDVEAVDKQRVNDTLQTATRDTQKGAYHKTRHGPELLESIRPEEVQSKSRHCKRLFDTLSVELAAE
jgi:hypothetical protein